MNTIGGVLGRRMQALREGNSMSQRDVAEQLGLDSSTLSRMEAGISRWQLDTFVHYSRVVGADPPEILADVLKQLSDDSPASLWGGTE